MRSADGALSGKLQFVDALATSNLKRQTEVCRTSKAASRWRLPPHSKFRILRAPIL